MYQTTQVLEILYRVNIKSAFGFTEGDSEVVFFTWADVPSTLNCKNCPEQCLDCPVVPAIARAILSFKKQVEGTVDGIALSNEIDWFKDSDKENYKSDKQYIFNPVHIILEKRINFFLVPVKLYKEQNPGQLVKVLNSYQRIQTN